MEAARLARAEIYLQTIAPALTTAPHPWVRIALGVAGIVTVIEGAVGY
jgi:hypothetical protein